MDRLGLPYQAIAPDYEEEHALALRPAELVQELAARKAQSLRPRLSDALVIGADQVAELDGQLLTKPGTAERAVAQLRLLAGRTHRLLTGLAVLDTASGRLERELDVQEMTMRALSNAQLERYVSREQPVDCAGAYRVEGPGIALFESTQGDDYSGIVGLPLTKLVALLVRFGVDPL